MEFTLDLPGFWSLTPAEVLRTLVGGYMPLWLAHGVVGALVGLIVRLVTRGIGLSTTVLYIAMGLFGVILAGQPLPLLAAVVVVYVTVATYRGAPGPRRSPARMLIVLALRLFALLLTMLTVTRPALLVRSEDKVPSVLVILADCSKSMDYKDEYNNQTRFEAMRSTLDRCSPIIQQLQEESQITVSVLSFAGNVSDWSAAASPDGPISDYGGALATAYQRFGNEPNLRGLLVLGDGADNGRRFDPQAEARKWKAIQCPVTTFGLGSGSTQPDQKDIAITTLVVEPAPVFVKGRMVIKATVDAPGCENAVIEPTILIDGRKVDVEKILINGAEPENLEPILKRTSGNELRIETSAPEVPGEIRVTLRIKPLPGEISAANNEVSTYVTVAKEGVAVLLVAPLDEETKYLRQVLMADPRIRLFETTRQTDAPPAAGEAELFNFERQAYDVVILRNVSARRLAAGNPGVMGKLRDLVKRGAGFMMLGGFDSFGGSPDIPGSGDWKGTPIEDLIPVQLDVAGHMQGQIEFHPTPSGASHYLLQLAAQPADSQRIWRRLNDAIKAPGMNRLGTPKPGADTLATSEPDRKGSPILVAQTFTKGRTLAYAGDSTFLWRIFGLPESTEGAEIHARFWKQTVLWLAQQENSEGSVWVRPDFRRLAAGAQQGFSVGVRGKSGIDLPGGRFESRIFVPDGSSIPVPTRRDSQGDRGQFWQTLLPGEYRIEVSGQALDVDQKLVTGKASVRFLVYQDEREMLQTAADPDLMGKIAAAGGGRPAQYRIDDLPDFLTKLKSAALPSEQVKVERYPDWRSENLRPFLPLWLILFVAVLGMEWALRRWWGMV